MAKNPRKIHFQMQYFASADIPIKLVWIGSHGSQVNISSDYGLVPSGNKTWANADQDLCRHMASLGLNELTGPPATWISEIWIIRLK